MDVILVWDAAIVNAISKMFTLTIKLSINNKICTLDEVQFLYKYNAIQHFILDRSVNRNLDEIEVTSKNVIEDSEE